MKFLLFIFVLLITQSKNKQLTRKSARFNKIAAQRFLELAEKASQIKDLLTPIIEEQNWTIEDQDDNSFIVKSEIGSENIDIFDVKIVQITNVQTDKDSTAIQISNFNNEKTFKYFQDSHLFIRQTYSDDQKINEKFLQAAVQKMKDEVALLKNNHSIKDVFSHFESIMSDPKFEKLKIQNKKVNPEKISLEIVTKESQTKVTNVLIKKRKHEMIHLLFFMNDDNNSYNIPIRSIESAKEIIQQEIQQRSFKMENKFEVDEVGTILQQTINEKCAQLLPKIETEKGESNIILLKVRKTNQETNSNEDPKCIFLNFDFLITKIDSGAIQKIHIAGFHPMLREEFLFSTFKGAFKIGFVQAIDLLINDFEIAKTGSFKDKTKTDDDRAFSESDFENLVEKAIGEKGNSEEFKVEELQKCSDGSYECVKKIRFPKSDAMFFMLKYDDKWVISVKRYNTKKEELEMNFEAEDKVARLKSEEIENRIREFMKSE